MSRFLFQFCFAVCLAFLFAAADIPHQRTIDDFSNEKMWKAEVLSQNYQLKLHHAGLFTTPDQNGATFRVREGKGFFHFPKLNEYAYSRQGFVWAYHLSNTPSYKPFPMLPGTNYLNFSLANTGPEPVWLFFRFYEDMEYLYGNAGSLSEALAELSTDTIVVPPGTQPKTYRLELKRMKLPESARSPRYRNTIKFFSFETGRKNRGNEQMPSIDCTLVFDHITLIDSTVTR